MRLWALLSAALLSTLVLAGCSDDGGGGETTSTTTTTTAAATTTTSRSATTTTTSSSTTTSTAPQDRAPTGSVSASLNGTRATFELAGSDADGDALSWTLVFGDATTAATGTELPATVTHNYTLGNYTANFTITGGQQSVSYPVDLVVSTGPAATVLTYSGDVLATCATTCEGCDPAAAAPVCAGGPGAFGCMTFNLRASPQPLPVPDFDCTVVLLPAATVGKPFLLTSTGGDPDLDFVDVCNPVDGVNAEAHWAAGPESGVVPAGYECAVLWEFNAVTPDTPSTISFVVG